MVNISGVPIEETLPGRGWEGHCAIFAAGQILGGIVASGAKSEVDEAIAQAGMDPLFKK
jgi:uncharacterized protein GlcG (DUF336 family)